MNFIIKPIIVVVVSFILNNPTFTYVSSIVDENLQCLNVIESTDFEYVKNIENENK